jgi:mono/diheme cytochrome c family protein
MYDKFREICSRPMTLLVMTALSAGLAGCGGNGMATTPAAAAAPSTSTTSMTGSTTTSTTTATTGTTGTTSTGTTSTGTTSTGTTSTGTTGTGTTGTGTTGAGTTGTGTTGTGTTGTGTTGTGTTGTGTTTTPATTSSVTLTAPGAIVNRMVVLTAAPTTPTGVNVVAVTFLVDGVAIGSTSSAPYNFQLETGAVADGTHYLTVSLTDSSGKTTISPSVSVKVMNNQALTVGLSASQIFPVPVSTATGFGTLTVNVVTGMATGNVVVTGTTATTVAIFQGFAGQTGTVQIPLTQNAANPKQFDVPAGTVLTQPQVTMLLQGSMYIQATSTAFPMGEIRGQIVPAGVTVTWTPLSGLQAVPIATTLATGTAATTVDSLANDVTVFVNTTGLTGVTTAQLLKGTAGTVGTELVALTIGTMTATVFNPNQFGIQMFWVGPAGVADFQNSMWYVNVATAANPAGALRGQVIPAPTLTSIQASIFTPICSTCHTGVGTTLPGALNLTTAAASYKALVGQFTVEQPTVQFVAPGNPATSYVIQKLMGTVGIAGKQMPLGGPYLSTAQILQIQQWIAAGPQNN